LWLDLEYFSNICLGGLRNNTKDLRIVRLRARIEPGTSRIRIKHSSRWTVTVGGKMMMSPHDTLLIEDSLSEGHIAVCVVNETQRKNG
jgi:hypothetical protein